MVGPSSAPAVPAQIGTRLATATMSCNARLSGTADPDLVIQTPPILASGIPLPPGPAAFSASAGYDDSRDDATASAARPAVSRRVERRLLLGADRQRAGPARRFSPRRRSPLWRTAATSARHLPADRGRGAE